MELLEKWIYECLGVLIKERIRQICADSEEE